MTSHAQPRPVAKVKSESTDFSTKQNLTNSPYHFVDNRKETMVQRKLASSMAATVSKGKPNPAAGPVGDRLDNKDIVQRQVFKSRKGGKWYTDKDPSRLFDTEEEAKMYQYELIDRELEAISTEKREKKEERSKKRKKELDEQYADYKPPKAKRAKLFKNNDKDSDEVDLTTLGPENAKKFMEFSFQQRKAELFRTQVINLGGFHHVLAPGTDIGLTPALLRPDLSEGDSAVPLSRDGRAKPYVDLAAGLDQLAESNVSSERTINEVRERIGRDLMRMTRGNPPKGTLTYSGEQLALLNEIAAVLRLDKGRVPKATRYIRNRIVKGDLTFHELFAHSKYVGAGSGGVQALRGQVEDDGDLSEGSDMEIDENVQDTVQENSETESGGYANQQELFRAILEGREGVGNYVFVHPTGEWKIASIRITQRRQSVQVSLRLRRRGG